jgi:protein translocase SecG subunit
MLFGIILPIIAVALAVFILAQSKGGGLGATFGEGGEFFSTKRGAEKLLSQITVALFVAFVVLAFAGGVMNLAEPSTNSLSSEERAEKSKIEENEKRLEELSKKEFVNIKTSKGDMIVELEGKEAASEDTAETELEGK